MAAVWGKHLIWSNKKSQAEEGCPHGEDALDHLHGEASRGIVLALDLNLGATRPPSPLPQADGVELGAGAFFALSASSSSSIRAFSWARRLSNSDSFRARGGLC